jgi:hypothetical protein
MVNLLIALVGIASYRWKGGSLYLPCKALRII